MTAFEIIVVGPGAVPSVITSVAGVTGWKVYQVPDFAGALARCAIAHVRRLVLVVGEVDGDTGLLDDLPAFRAAHPGVPAVIAVGVGQADVRRLPKFACSGLDGFVLIDGPLADLRTHLEQMLTTQLPGHLVQRVLAAIPSKLVHFYAWMLRAASLGVSVEQCCAWLGISESALRKRARAAKVTSPGQWLGLGRCLRVAHWVETTSDPFVLIAKRLGFPSASAMSALVRRELRMTTRELRELGGTAHVLKIVAQGE